jgi:hypothetical protein
MAVRGQLMRRAFRFVLTTKHKDTKRSKQAEWLSDMSFAFLGAFVPW